MRRISIRVFVAIAISFAALLPLVPQAAGDSPIEVPFEFVFDDTNPCTGLVHTVTITGTSWVHDHDGRLVVVSERTITTSTGFQGHGRDSGVLNGETLTFTLTDVLTDDDSGDRIRAHLTLVVDLSTSTVRVFGGAVICIGP